MMSSNCGIAVILVALRVGRHLTEAHMIGGRPGADHMNRRFAAGGVEAAPQRFTVDRDDLPVGNLLQRSDPTEQTLLKFSRLQRAQNRIETIMRRNAAAHVEKLRQPLLLILGPIGDRHEIIGPTQHRTERHRHHVDQRVGDLPSPRIGQIGKVFLNRSGRRRHARTLPAKRTPGRETNVAKSPRRTCRIVADCPSWRNCRVGELHFIVYGISVVSNFVSYQFFRFVPHV